MKINKIRSLLYKVSKYLGDFQAVISMLSKKSVFPVLKRIGRRIYGKIASRGFSIFK